MTPRWVALVLAGALSGCAVGPDYRKPVVDLPATWAQAPSGVVTAEAASVATWWRAFGDPVLDALVERAVAGSLDLRIATARVREARALRGVAAGDRWPTIDASGLYNRVRDSENARPLPRGFDPNHDLFQLGLDASWEVDVWGRVRRSVEAADATLASGVENRRDVLVILLAEVARNLVEVRTAQQRLVIARNNIAAQREIVDLSRVRRDAGLGTDVEVSQAQSLLLTTEAQVPALAVARDQAIHRIAVLTGQPPGALLAELRDAAPIPVGPPSVPVGLPSDVLRQRPDIRRAERDLAAATARIGVATAELFPRFSLTGMLGVSATEAADLFTGSSRFFGIGPQVVWPVFAGGRIRSNIRVQEARQEAALANYEQTILGALEETENALVAWGNERARKAQLVEAADASRLALGLSRELYVRGLADFLVVLDNQRAVYSIEDQLVQSDRTLAVALIALYKALGGGWDSASAGEVSR